MIIGIYWQYDLLLSAFIRIGVLVDWFVPS